MSIGVQFSVHNALVSSELSYYDYSINTEESEPVFNAATMIFYRGFDSDPNLRILEGRVEKLSKIQSWW